MNRPMPFRVSRPRGVANPLAMLLILATALPVVALEMDGHSYPDTVTVAGRTLHRIGAGKREATIFKVDVYVGAVYAEHRSCDMAALVTRDQARLFYMDFLRDVPADKLKDNMIDNFRNHTPADASPDLRHRIDGFIGLFDRAAKKGSRVEIRYIPGEGTSVSAAGKVLAAPVPGADFASVVWDIWFGRKTCCPDLLRSVRRTCGKE
jgi:hypothetical protein